MNVETHTSAVGPGSMSGLEDDENEYGEDDMMFELEQDAEFTSLEAELGASFVQPASFQLRPPNPVAALLRASDDDEDPSARSTAQASATRRPRALAQTHAQAATAASPSGDTVELFEDFNGRRKRKHDESRQASHTVRPMAKRAKSFSSLSDMLPTEPFPVNPTLRPIAIPRLPPSNALFNATANPNRTASLFPPRSASIRIPQSSPRAQWSPLLSRSVTHGLAERRCKSAEPRTSASWNARTPSPLDYACRRSLDVSSPLRQRFRDLVVGSVGQHTGSLSSS